MDPVFYPLNDFGPVMKGLAIGGLGIFHVFTAHFAIGGGFLMCWLQWLHMTGKCPPAKAFADGYFRFLVLVSFITGALTGVGMWFTSIQVSPQTIGLMIDQFHWLWAVEWTFFSLEVVAGYSVYRYGKRLNDRARLGLFGLYTFAAWMSLFWINGILAFQLTPGKWLVSHDIWDAFFNPTFWPSLFYRTIACLTVASLVAMVAVNASHFTRDEKAQLIRAAAWLMTPMIAMPVLGVWYVLALPADSQEWILGGSMTMTMFLNIAVGSSAMIAGYAIVGLLRQHLYINGATALVLCAMAFAATAGGEFVREGARKPYSLREILYSNAVRPEQVENLRRTGLTARDPYPLRDEDDLPRLNGQAHPQLRVGALTYRDQCGICHTLGGVNSLTGLTWTWDDDMKRQNFAKLQHLKPFMPPFCGSPDELEALVQYVGWVQAARPPAWADPAADPGLTAARTRAIRTWLDAAGTTPNVRRPQPARGK